MTKRYASSPYNKDSNIKQAKLNARNTKAIAKTYM